MSASYTVSSQKDLHSCHAKTVQIVTILKQSLVSHAKGPCRLSLENLIALHIDAQNTYQLYIHIDIHIHIHIHIHMGGGSLCAKHDMPNPLYTSNGHAPSFILGSK